MFDMKELLGALVGSGMTESSPRRIEHALGNQGAGQTGGLLGQILGAVQGAGSTGIGGTLDRLASIARGVLGEASGAVQSGNPLAVGGLASLAGAVLGGGSGAAKGAVGGGALALLAGLAMHALQNFSAPSAGASTAALPVGLRDPSNAQEEQELEAMALLSLRAMVQAAKADGTIDATEQQRILGKLQEAGADAEAQAFVAQEMAKPLDLAGLLRDVPNQQRAAEVYAASLLAIEVDTPAERTYLQRLAEGLGLDADVVQRLHASLGVH